MAMEFLEKHADNGQLIRIGDDRMKLEDLGPGDCFVVSYVPWVVESITAVIVGDKKVVDIRVVRVEENQKVGVADVDADRPVAGSSRVVSLSDQAREAERELEERADESLRKMTTTITDDWP